MAAPAAFAETPAGFPSASLTSFEIDAVKGGVAGTACALLGLGALLGRLGHGSALRRSRDALLAALGLAGLLCGFDLLRLHGGQFVHLAEFYHYYVGGKYYSELGYTGLYPCAAVAEAELMPNAPVAERWMRNLETNRIEKAATALADPGLCKGRFTPDRWQAFRKDVAWFRVRLANRWRLAQADHGFNAPPAWGMLGIPLANLAPASGASIHALASLDLVLLAASASALAWAFGWRVLCVAAVFWGTNFFAPFGWTGGGFLRNDWLAAVIVGLCLLRRDRPLAAGLLLAWAAWLRLFPALILAGPALQAIVAMARARRVHLARDHRRLLAGCLLATAFIVPVSSLTAGGVSAWRDFAENSRLHLATPLRNHVGLRTLLSFDADSVARLVRDTASPEPYLNWRAARRDTFAGRRAIFAGAVLAHLALLAVAASRNPMWVAGVLAIGLVPVAAELTSYYWAVLAGFALLHERRESVGAALCGLAAGSWWIAGRWIHYDEVFTWASAAALAFVAYATVAMLVSLPKETRAAAP